MKNDQEFVIDSNNFRCPFCKSKLIIGNKERVQTLNDHVSDPNGGGSVQNMYICSNNECKANDDNFKIKWDWGGDRYTFGHDYIGVENFVKTSAINKNDAPFGTSMRKINVEIYKKNLKDNYINLYPSKFTFNWGFKIENLYFSDYEGNVIKRKFKLVLLHNDTIYISGVKMLIFVLTNYFKDRKSMRKFNSISGAVHVLDSFNPPSWDRRWWRKTFLFIINTFYTKDKITAKNIKIAENEKTKKSL